MLVSLLTMTLATAAPDGHHIVEADLTCPIGGEEFKGEEVAVVSTYGSRPDGRPYSYLSFPLPLNICPGNGFVMFDREFAADEVETLAAAIASADYKAMQQRETVYYRGYWLARAVDNEEREPLWLLMRAVWEARNANDTAMAERYLDEFAAGAAVSADDTIDGQWLLIRGANAHRERGRFVEASAMLDRMVPFAELPGDHRERDDYSEYVGKLRAVILREDKSTEPLDLVPEMAAISHCAGGDLLARARALGVEHLVKVRDISSPFDVEWCADPNRAERIAEMKERLEGVDLEEAAQSGD